MPVNPSHAVTVRTVEVAGVTICCRETGEPGGRPVVLLHGGGSSAATWDRLAASLAPAGCHVIAADLRGHGGSSRTPAYPLAGFRNDAIGLLDALALDEFSQQRRSRRSGRIWGTPSMSPWPRVTRHYVAGSAGCCCSVPGCELRGGGGRL